MPEDDDLKQTAVEPAEPHVSPESIVPTDRVVVVDSNDVAKPPQTMSSSTPTKRDSGAWIGGAVWLVMLGVGAYVWFFGANADVLLNVSGPDPLMATGTVTHSGVPVSAGIVQVLIEDPRDGRHLTSDVTDVKMGSFRLEFKHSLLAENPKRELLVTARYFGQTSDKQPKSLKGTSTLYVNLTPPWSMGWGAIVVLLPTLVLVVLFTGPLSPQKARLLFGVTYIVTFSACVIPIILTVSASRSRYLLETMESAPVGIIKAKAKGLDQPQWLVNIGGAVTKQKPVSEKPASLTIVSESGKQLGGTLPPDQGAMPAAGGPGTVKPSSAMATKSAQPSVDEPEQPVVEVRGGLAIPLYVLILAMLGAAINMTRKVPEIQADYDSNATATLTGALTAPVVALEMVCGRKGESIQNSQAPSQIRKELIETYMYFLSAPFLAVAVYYLLQVIASSVAEPVLVVVAFASGLMSNTTVGAIVTFADKTLERVKQPSSETGAAENKAVA